MNIQGIFLQRLKRAHLLTRLFTTTKEEKIEIPMRIHRGPTDILRALESTIKQDPTAAHYKYHDDPYLIPNNNIMKRSYAMAQEAGRKAAHWVRNENPELFNHRECDPPIELFFPKLVYTEESEVTEQDLLNVIDKNQVSDAILIYTIFNSKGIEISNEARQSLLEFLCYNNSKDVLEEVFIEERWFKQSSSVKERQRKTWKDGNVAEEVFKSIENPNAEAYSAIIQGMAKFNQSSRAYQLFEEAQQKGLNLDVNAYNSIIKVSNFLKEGYDMRWAFVVNMLQNIKQAGLKPNLETLNSVLCVLSTMGNSKMVKHYIVRTLQEFKALGIEPSLGSWYYVLIAICKERGPKSSVLANVLMEVANKSHEIRDISDTNFFVTAMDVANNHLNNVILGQKVHELLMFKNNYDLIGDSYKESIYYRHYFNLLLANVPLDHFIEKTYNQFVPNVYVPEPTVMKEVIKQIDLNGAVDYIPQIWSDMVIFGHNLRADLINLILKVIVDNKPDNSETTEKFSKIGWDIYTTIEGQDEQKFNNMKFSGEMLGGILLVLLRNNEFTKACLVMDKLINNNQNIIGVPSFDSLSLFVDHCIENKTLSKAIECIQFASDTGFPNVLALGAKLNEKCTLDEMHLNKLSKVVDLKIN
ncbi:small ribosomal subunit protein mS39 [Euwallacea fornicatus]|uniref:small ribosomal subunit protein mS39 n=1 Tax=Euwallacea fornicatus TaxID=995702 RepID=UPI00338D5366